MAKDLKCAEEEFAGSVMNLCITAAAAIVVGSVATFVPGVRRLYVDNPVDCSTCCSAASTSG